ncbi:MAG: DMT family transporter [Pseudomonadota bacterium]
MPDRARSVLFMLAAAAFIAASTLFAKALGLGGMNPFQVSFGRFIFALLGLLAVAAILRPRIQNPHLTRHFLRAFFGWVGATLLFASVARMPAAEATAISFLSPIVTMLLAIPLLGERVGLWRWGAAALGFAGAIVLLRPGADAVQLAGLLAIGAAVAMGAESIVIKKLTNTEPKFQILILNNTIGTLISGAIVLLVWQMPSGLQWAQMAGTGLMMVCGQVCFLQAISRTDASFATPFFYTTLVFAALYDAVLFGVIPSSVGLLGAGMILSAAALLLWRGQREPV